MYSPPPDPADEHRMRAAFAHAATTLNATPRDAITWGWFGRTAGARVTTPDGRPAWLRVVAAAPDKAHGKHWDGARAAQDAFGDLDGARPELLALHDWTDSSHAYRAELTDYIDAPLCSTTPTLTEPLDLPDAWWSTLRTTLATLAAAPTDRTAVRQVWIDRAVPQYLGLPAPQPQHLATAHGDLHWANLTRRGPVIFDWEGWGSAPAGYDAAMLFAYSLRVPATAAQVRAAFPILDTETGRVAETIVAAELFQTFTRGDNKDMEPAVRRHAAQRLAATTTGTR